MPRWDVIDLGLADLDSQNPEEQMGSKAKNWVRLTDDARPWLVKLARVDDHDGTVSGEDWAEWLVHYLADLIGVATATIRPARFRGQRAVVSRSVLDTDSQRLVHGNELLSVRQGYVQSLRGENPGYTVPAVRKALEGVAGPEDRVDLRSFTAYNIWAGYLMLDAWVSGRDRHPENWAVIQVGNDRRLAPSFDHGNALGFQERDVRRERMLGDEFHFDRWLDRGTNSHVAGKPHLVSLAAQALSVASPAARDHWYERLDAVSTAAVDVTVRSVPETLLSEVGRNFVTALLQKNRGRLIDGYAASRPH